MISAIMFSCSALCFAAMFKPGKPSKPSQMPVYTYYVCDDSPLPTWRRKVARPARIAERVG